MGKKSDCRFAVGISSPFNFMSAAMLWIKYRKSDRYPVLSLFCIVGNIVNVLMEEGAYIEDFSKILQQKYKFIAAAIICSIYLVCGTS